MTLADEYEVPNSSKTSKTSQVIKAENIAKALHEIRYGDASIQKAASKYGIARSTLQIAYTAE